MPAQAAMAACVGTLIQTADVPATNTNRPAQLVMPAPTHTSAEIKNNIVDNPAFYFPLYKYQYSQQI